MLPTAQSTAQPTPLILRLKKLPFGFLGKGTFDYNAPSAEIFRFGNWGRAGKGLLLLQISILKETRGHFIAIFSEHQSGFGLVH